MKLANKTRAGSVPGGKPRVYFAAHPEDYDLMDVISDDILKFQDCAVYYDTEPLADYEKDELYGNLETVQLLVIPVTEKFLREENRALEVEYPYAIRNHIPVLPFMQRKGLRESLQDERAYYGNLANEFNEKLRKLFSRRTGQVEARRLTFMYSPHAMESGESNQCQEPLMGSPSEPKDSKNNKNRKYKVIRRLPGSRRLKENGAGSARYLNLQMLNKYDQDPTAIPYEEKLRKFLSYILVSDELAAKIREAFDAYIFLSYRKKDREHANRLIKLIHKNEFCRDIAIWFDEFLVPGESFSKAIEEAMEKSSLFTFAVTPNVLEEPNFVKDEEYVRAKKAAEQKGKVIFPVELVPLAEREEKELKEKFPGIPERINVVGNLEEGGKGELFRQALLDAIKRSGIRFGEGSLEHNFLIGMAYMNGIDVEKDIEKAMELIQEAAKGGLPEAISELTNMYSTGKGVALDYREAARWQEMEVPRLREEFAGQQSVETAQRLVDALLKLGDYRYEVRDLEGAGAAYGELEGILEKFKELCPESEEPTEYLADYYMKMAKNLYSAGKMEAAGQYLQKHWKYAEVLDNPSYKMTNREMMGHIHRKQGNFDQAEKEYREAYGIAEKLYEVYKGTLLSQGESQKNRDYAKTVLSQERICRRNLMYCSNMMGRISEEKGRTQDAVEYYSRMLEMCLQLEKEEKTPKSRQDLALAYAKMGDASRSLNRLEDSRQYIQKAQDIYQDLYEKYGTMEVKRGLSLTCERLGDLCMDENKPDEAMVFYERYFELSNELYEAGD